MSFTMRVELDNEEYLVSYEADPGPVEPEVFIDGWEGPETDEDEDKFLDRLRKEVIKGLESERQFNEWWDNQN